MTEIFFHCGSYKTGTSSIQNCLYKNREILESMGVLYPTAGLVTHQERIGVRHAKFAYAELGSMKLEVLVQQLISQISSSGCKKIVVSSEAWSNTETHDCLEFVVGALRKAGFGQIKGLLALRNRNQYAIKVRDEWAHSWGSDLTQVEFIESKRHLFDYDKIVSRLDRIFKGKLLLQNYHSIEDSVLNLFEVCGLVFDETKIVRSNYNLGDPNKVLVQMDSKNLAVAEKALSTPSPLEYKIIKGRSEFSDHDIQELIGL